MTGSVFELRWRAAYASLLLAACCQAHADGDAAGAAPGAAQGRLGLFTAEAGAGCPNTAGCAEDGRSWSGYLLGFRKFFGAERLFSRISLFGYDTVGHGGRDAAGLALPEGAGASSVPPARMSGYMLNLHLPQPSRDSAGPRYGWGGLTYIAHDELPLRQGWKTRGVTYALHFDDCMRLEGLYGRTAGLDRYGLGFGQDNWSVSLAGGAGEANMSLHVGYAIPLDGTGGGSGTCGAGSRTVRSFGAGWPAQ